MDGEKAAFWWGVIVAVIVGVIVVKVWDISSNSVRDGIREELLLEMSVGKSVGESVGNRVVKSVEGGSFVDGVGEKVGRSVVVDTEVLREMIRGVVREEFEAREKPGMDLGDEG